MSSEAQIYCVSGVKDWFASSPLDRTNFLPDNRITDRPGHFWPGRRLFYAVAGLSSGCFFRRRRCSMTMIASSASAGIANQ